MTRPQMVLVCQSADTRLAGEDGDHVATMKLSEKELHRILEHGPHFPFLTPKERDEGGNGHWRTRMGRKRLEEADDGKRHRRHYNGMIRNPFLRYRAMLHYHRRSSLL
jgi:hypothetical protein